MIPIVPTSRLYLSVAGLPGEHRFAAVFPAVWSQIPFGPRRALVRYWRLNHQGRIGVPLPESLRILRQTANLPVHLAQHGPLVQLISEPARFDHPGPEAVGMCSCWGFRLKFLQPVVARLDDVNQATLIAHELGHALLFAWGDAQEDEFNADLDVADLIGDWGFDDDALGDALQQAAKDTEVPHE
jgi:hypothetical protein